jgi:hypothetical protein
MECSAGQDYRCSVGYLTCATMLLVQDWQETVYSTDVADIGLVHHHKAGASRRFDEECPVYVRSLVHSLNES